MTLCLPLNANQTARIERLRLEYCERYLGWKSSRNLTLNCSAIGAHGRHCKRPRIALKTAVGLRFCALTVRRSGSYSYGRKRARTMSTALPICSTRVCSWRNGFQSQQKHRLLSRDGRRERVEVDAAEFLCPHDSECKRGERGVNELMKLAGDENFSQQMRKDTRFIFRNIWRNARKYPRRNHVR